MLSGAVINPKGIRELMPDFVEQGFPTEHVCSDDKTYLFVGKAAIPLPMNPPMFEKRGYHVASLNKVAKWLAGKCEARGIDIYAGFSGDKLLVEGGKVVGVRLGDMGVDKHGKPKAHLSGRHGHPREGHRARRRRARQPHEAADRALRPRRREPAGLRDGHQGDLARQAREASPGSRDPRHAAAEPAQVLRRHVALRHEGQPGVVRHGVRPRRAQPLPRSAPRGAEVQDAPVHARAARRCGARAVRREDDPDRRHVVDAEAVLRRRAARRRRGGLLQRREARGRPHGDEVRA